MLDTTLGQLLVNEVLPEDMRDYNRTLDGKSLHDLLKEVARKHPEKYRDVSFRLNQIGLKSSQAQGGLSFGIEHLRTAKAAQRVRENIRKDLEGILSDESLSDEERSQKIILATSKHASNQIDDIYREALENKNPIAMQIKSGSRGKPVNLSSLIGSDVLYADHRDEVIPIPILRSYSEGLSPEEYWAGTYGARKGILATKLCLAEGTLVRMADLSTKPIEEIQLGDMVLGADKSGKTFPVKVTNTFNNGLRECYNFTFRQANKQNSFFELQATEEHKVLTQWKKQTGRFDRTPVVLPLSAGKIKRKKSAIEFCAVLPSGSKGIAGKHVAEALLAGLMLGDGCMAPSAHGSYSLSCADPLLIEDTASYLAKFNLALEPIKGNYNHALVELEKQKLQTTVVNGHNCFATGHVNKTKRWLRTQLGDKLAHQKHLPKDINTWGIDSLCQLLGGLFSADGCISVGKTGTVTVSLYLTSKAIVTEVKTLMENRLGIWTSPVEEVPTTKRKNAKNPLYGFKFSSNVSLTRFLHQIKLVGIKRILAEKLKSRFKDDSDHLSCRLYAKQALGLLPTYDIEVDHPDHLFVLSNGLIVSNSTQNSGYLSKQLVQAAHRLAVVDEDEDLDPEQKPLTRGLVVDTDDMDNEGALLAKDTGPYKRNTPLTPKILNYLKRSGVDRILVRSPAVGGSPEGGVYARDVGIRERGALPGRGELVGMQAAQAISEPLSQAMLCLAKGTLVRMADFSTKPIEEIKIGDKVFGSDKQGNIFPVAVKKVYDNGVRTCHATTFTVSQTKETVVLNSTLDHKLLTKVSRWHPTNQIVEFGLYPVNEKCVQYAALLTKSVCNTASKQKEPMALLLGLLLGDGCYTAAVHSVNLSCFDPTLIVDLQPKLATLGLKATKLKGHIGYYRLSQITDKADRNQSGQFKLGFRNPIKKKLHDLYMQDKYAHEKFIPSCVWGWDDESLLNLIAGLYITDGSIYSVTGRRGEERTYITYGSTSLALVSELKQLLKVRFAIHASPIYANECKRKRSLYSLNITRQQDVANFAKLLSPYMLGVKKAKFEQARTASSTRDTQYMYRKQSVPLGDLPTYDIEVDHPDHLFVLANGLIVSNSSKHSGGIAGQEKTTGGFDYINQLVQVPKQLKGGATHSTKDGTVQRVEQAPAGGHFVYVNDVKHFVPEELEIKVKKGDTVEAGDTLSDGIPNPAVITQYKGVGEGRRYFVNELRKTMKATGLSPHRRNIELLARGLINHVRLTEEMGDHVPDDVVPYSTLEHTYQPRQGFQSLAPKAAVGQYLERPVLHYSIGSKIRPSMLKDLEYFGVSSVDVHKDPPPFEPAMIRGMNSLQNDPDWLVQMYGSGLKKSLVNSTARGAISEERGSSFVPSLAQGKDFGRGSDRIVIKPQEPFKAPTVPDIDFDSNLLKAGFDLASDSLLAKAPTSENLKPLGSKPLTEAVSSGAKAAPTLDDPVVKNPVAQSKPPASVPATAAGVNQVQPQQASITGALMDGAKGLAKGLVGYSLATKATDAIANKVNPAMFAPIAGPPAPRTWSNLPKRFVAGAKTWIPGNNLTTAATTTPTSAPASVASKTLPAIGAYTAFNGIKELAEGGIGLGANALAETLPEDTISPETRESMRQMGWNQDQFNDSVANLQYQGNVGDAVTAGQGVASALNNPLHTSVTLGQAAYEIGNRMATPMGNRLAFMADEYFGGPNSEVDSWDLGKFRDNLANRAQALSSLNTPEAKARVEEYNRLLKQYDESNGWLSRLSLMPAQFKSQLEQTVAAKKSRIFEIQQQLSQPNLDPTTAAALKDNLAALQTDLVDYRSFGT